MRHLILGVLAALVTSFAVAQVPAASTVSWVAPTTGSGKTIPLTGVNLLTGYNVYLSTTPLSTAPATPTVTATATATTVLGSITAHVGDTVYAYVVACNSIGCSALSDPGTFVVPAPPSSPDPPTLVTVTITVTLH